MIGKSGGAEVARAPGEAFAYEPSRSWQGTLRRVSGSPILGRVGRRRNNVVGRAGGGPGARRGAEPGCQPLRSHQILARGTCRASPRIIGEKAHLSTRSLRGPATRGTIRVFYDAPAAGRVPYRLDGDVVCLAPDGRAFAVA